MCKKISLLLLCILLIGYAPLFADDNNQEPLIKNYINEYYGSQKYPPLKISTDKIDINDDKATVVIQVTYVKKLNLEKIDGKWSVRDKKTEKKPKKTKGLGITDWKWKQSYSNIEIQGVVQNNTGKTVRNVKIYITARDGDGEYLGNAWTYLSPDFIAPGDSSNFKTHIMDTENTTDSLKISYKFDYR
ncbi:MAG: FxLYD domain-containing protein [Candidatus Margulisiibacteriota bacterium]|nr:FxLYD domain-containing protein [Candidatus Margulisiibacteriota bacterium]